MGTLTSLPYDVDEGREYAAYLERVLKECHRLLDEGRLPGGEAVAGFLEDAELIGRRVRLDVAGAGPARTIRSVVSMSVEEHQRYLAMGDSVRNLLEILELRQALELNRTAAVARVANCFATGEFTP